MINIEITKNIKQWANDNLGTSFVFREHQLEIIETIIDNYLNDNKRGNLSHNIVQAPTGSGKSLINIITAGVLYTYYNTPSYILCSDLYLYKQYEDFIDKFNLKDFGYLKGQTGNYTCVKTNDDVRIAECKIKKAKYKELFIDKTTKKSDIKNPCKFAYECKCPYIEERKKAVNAGITLMTYQLYFFQMNICKCKTDTHNMPLPGAFMYRPLILCDECHNIPSIIQNQCRPCLTYDDKFKLLSIYNYFIKIKTDPSFKRFYAQRKNKLTTIFKNASDFTTQYDNIWNVISDETLDSYHNNIALFNYEKFIRNIWYMGNVIQNYMKTKLNKGFKLSSDDWKIHSIIAWLQNFHCYLDDFSQAVQETGWVYTIKQKQKGNKFTFSCVKEDGMISHFLLSHTNENNERVFNNSICVSATIGDIEAFKQNMGYSHIEISNVHYNDIDSTFDFSNSPIYIYDNLKMSYNVKSKNMLSMALNILNILKKHNDENGIIQTGSYANANDLYKLLPKKIQSRILIYKDAKTKTECIEKIRNNTNYVLIGPSLNEGIDLPGKLCSFIIVMKIPYMSLADKYVKAKMKIFKKWYASTAANNLIQGIGRGNRFVNDKSTIYILDGCFERLFKSTQKQFPKYIIDRFIKLNDDEFNKINDVKRAA